MREWDHPDNFHTTDHLQWYVHHGAVVMLDGEYAHHILLDELLMMVAEVIRESGRQATEGE